MATMLGIYFFAGLIFGIYFSVAGFQKLDASASSVSIFVRLLWLPAAVALWPVLLLKLVKGDAI